MTRLRKHLSYANVMATIAVFLAMGGGAYAVTAIDDNSVRSRHIVDNEVRSADVRNDNLTGGGLTARDLRAGSVGPSEANGLTGLDIADGTLQGEDIATEAVGSDEVGTIRVVESSTSVPAGSSGSRSVSCEFEEQLIGGGAYFQFPSVGHLGMSRSLHNTPPSWLASGRNTHTAAQSLTAQALCLTRVP